MVSPSQVPTIYEVQDMPRRRAFTLIELLVVIAIIAVLMAILMPALRRVQKQARGVVCQSRLKQWGLMFSMYTNDHDGSFNPGWDPVDGGEPMLWPVIMRPYYQNSTEMLECPMATKPFDVHEFGPQSLWQRTFATGSGFSLTVDSSYSINNWTNAMQGDRGSRLEEWFWKNVNNNTNYPDRQAVNRNNIPVFADGTWHDAWVRDTDDPPAFDGEVDVGNFGTSDEMKQFCISRHGSFINVCFMDWTVRKIGLKELWTLKWHRNFDLTGPWTTAGGVSAADWPEWMRSFKDY